MAALTEFELIDRFFRRPENSADNARGIVLGIGDDAALLALTPGNQLAASVDMLVSGRHFFADVEPEALGHKVLAVNLSDMAAMGATPRWALLAGALPDADAQWLKGFARGFFALATARSERSSRSRRRVCTARNRAGRASRMIAGFISPWKAITGWVAVTLPSLSTLVLTV